VLGNFVKKVDKIPHANQHDKNREGYESSVLIKQMAIEWPFTLALTYISFPVTHFFLAKADIGPFHSG